MVAPSASASGSLSADVIDEICGAPSHFAALGLAASRQSQADVRKAFRKRALLVHPDKCDSERSHQAFQTLAAAYEAVHDPVQQHRLLNATSREPKRARREKPKADGARCRSWAEWERELERRDQLERSFLAAQGQRYAQRKAVQSLRRAERCVAELDARAGIDDNPLVPASDGGSDAGGAVSGGAAAEDAADPGRLLHLLLYLRETHLYCLFCGSRFDSMDELESYCPGLLAEAHDDE